MALKINPDLTPERLGPKITRLFELSADKILNLERTWTPRRGVPVFTVEGRYASRGWTEWTQGFRFGSALLQFDATGDAAYLELGRRGTVEHMASHLSDVGVHDHGFNNLSTYGNLLRLMGEGRIEANESERQFYELALKVSGAVQASRWTSLADGSGFLYSFNGPHSLFVDTLRSGRALAVAHQLGQVLREEQDTKISLLQRLVEHIRNTARYNVYYGTGRDAYDLRGRVAHEAIFNVTNGVFRCPSSQQGFSPFTTWTRGLAWAILGFAEQIEFLVTQSNADLTLAAAGSLAGPGDRSTREDAAVSAAAGSFLSTLGRAANVTADFYLANCCADGIPMWDTGAPNLARLEANYLDRPADPFNAWEPVDSSAAAIAAQGLLRLGNFLVELDRPAVPGEAAWRRDRVADGVAMEDRRTPAAAVNPTANARRDRRRRSCLVRLGRQYRQAGLTIAGTLFSEPYLATHHHHQGLILHSVYHRPNGWDHVARGQKVPNGESSMWGDYHARELALGILREARGEPLLTFFGGRPHG